MGNPMTQTDTNAQNPLPSSIVREAAWRLRSMSFTIEYRQKPGGNYAISSVCGKPFPFASAASSCITPVAGQPG
jgi:hypothetical protein